MKKQNEIRNDVTRLDVERALALFKTEGTVPTIADIKAAVGGGSYTTLLRFRNEIESEQKPPPPNTEPQRDAFDTVWSDAIARGRAERDVELAEATGTIAELLVENQKLETEMTNISARFGRVETQRDEMMAQLNAAIEATTKSRAAGEQHAAKLAKAHTRITGMQDAHFKAVEKLRSALNLAESKAHALELALARAETKLDERSAS